MDETLKTRVIAALRESARAARTSEQQNEAMALIEALCEDAEAMALIEALCEDATPAVAATPDASVGPRDDVQATAKKAEKAAFAKANAPSDNHDS